MSDTRNVIDRYKGWMEDLIREDLKKKAFPYAVCMENWLGDFNIGTLVRNANAFGAREVYYLGDSRKWDRRGAVGTYKYTHVIHLKGYEELANLKKRYRLVGVDCVPGSSPVESYTWEPETLMIFGEEGTGITPNTLSFCEKIVHITQHGSVRSLNAGTASGIAMFHLLQHNRFPPP